LGRFSGQSQADGSFTLPGVQTARGDITVLAEASLSGRRVTGASAPTPPVPAGTTDVGTIVLEALRFEPIGDAIDPLLFGDVNDGAALVSLPFPFRFYGVDYTEAFVGVNGYLTFGSPDGHGRPDVGTFANLQPRIAPLFRDWQIDFDTHKAAIYRHPALAGRGGRMVVSWEVRRQPGGWSDGGGSFVTPAAPAGAEQSAKAQAAGRAPRISGVTEGGDTPISHFQVVLFADGRIQFGYDGVPERTGIVGLTPGDVGAMPEAFDFSATPALAVGATTAPYEEFLGFPDSPFDLDHTF